MANFILFFFSNLAVAAPENISFVSVTYSCVRIHWNDVPPERYGLFVGYVVLYDFVYQSSFSMYKQTSPGFIHEVEICGLQPLSKYKFYVRRVLLESKLGNGSSVQLFTTLEARKLLKFWLKCFPQSKRFAHRAGTGDQFSCTPKWQLKRVPC